MPAPDIEVEYLDTIETVKQVIMDKEQGEWSLHTSIQQHPTLTPLRRHSP